MTQNTKPTGFISTRESTCGDCREELGRSAWITLVGDRATGDSEALCLVCADMEHLVFLPSVNATLTRRSKKYSILNAVVLRWSRARKRYERQGLLVESEALERAEQECLADSDARARRRERAAELRAQLDLQYVERFALRVRQLFPHCPPGREEAIAEHACLKYSARIGRTAAAKDLEEDAVRLAVIAHVRHAETRYTALLAEGYDRWEARAEVADTVSTVLTKWGASE